MSQTTMVEKDLCKRDSKFYATCPYCGRRLCKAVPGSEIETDCPKCTKTVFIQVDKDGMVKAKVLDTQHNLKNS